MKILIASDAYIYQTNGVTAVVVTLANGLRQMGHDVRVLATADGRKSFRCGDDYFIRSLPAFYYPDMRICYSRRDPLLDELKRWKPDVIHLHSEATIAQLTFDIAAATGAPIIITTHTDYGRYAFGRFHDSLAARALTGAVGRAFYRHGDVIVVPSEKARHFNWLKAYADRVEVIPNGIRLERYQKPVSAEDEAVLRRLYGIADNGCTLVMVTRLSREKNIMEILHYFPALLRELPEAQLVIAGDGPDRRRLETYCERSGLSEYVYFTGRVSSDEVYRYYGLGDVFVSASTFEVHSITYLEAMACGLPLVCREDACLRNVLDEGENGFSYETERGFVEATVKILRDSALRETMRGKALEKAEEYSDRHFLERTLALYKKTCDSIDRI